MNIEHVSGFKYRIPREGKMRVDAAFYASEAIFEDLKRAMPITPVISCRYSSGWQAGQK